MGPDILFPKTQNQIAQLEILFKGPLIKNSIVNSINDLILLDIKFNYEHKMIWVKNEQSNYFLNSGDGSVISHWKKQTNKLVIDQYLSNKTWFKDDMVYISGKIYKALQNVPLNYNPFDYTLYWLLITGEQITSRLIFNNSSNVLIYTEIKNPFFQIIKCNFVLDTDNNYILDENGLIKIENSQIIDAFIKRRNDLPNNSGSAYEIIFESNSLPINLTGIINIK